MTPISESELLEACKSGDVLDCSVDSQRREVDAALIRRLCLNLADQVDPRGLSLRNARIVGQLDLAGTSIHFPLRFSSCDFDSPLIVEGARLYELALISSTRLPGLLANGLQVYRDLDLSQSKLTGKHLTSASMSKRAAIWLCECDIGGALLCVDTIVFGEGGRAIHGDRLHVGATVRLARRFVAIGEVRLSGAHIGGSLDMTGARIESQDELALDLSDTEIGGGIFLKDDLTGRTPVIYGRFELSRARVSGGIVIRNALLNESTKIAAKCASDSSPRHGIVLSAPRLSTSADVRLEELSTVNGGIDLSMSHIGSLFLKGTSLHAAGGVALNLTNAELRSTLTFDERVTVEGTLNLMGVHIHGNLSLRGADLSAPEGASLVSAQWSTIDGDVALQNLRTRGGQLSFRAATVGSIVEASGAHLVNPGGLTLSLHQATIKGSVRLVSGFKSEGTVLLNRATIDGRFQCTAGSFICEPSPTAANHGDAAIVAIAATILGGMILGWAEVRPSVNFTNTRTTFLADDPLNWPSRFVISGFTYDRFDQSNATSTRKTRDGVARRIWLSCQIPYDASPYEVAARVFRQHGDGRGAEEILIAQHKHARTTMTGKGGCLRRAIDTTYDLTVGYGYRPARVLWALAILLVLVFGSLEVPSIQEAMRASAAGTVYSPEGPLTDSVPKSMDVRSHGMPPDVCGNGEVRCFSPVLYSIDTVIPLISLEQRSAWYPDPHVHNGRFEEWWLSTATLLGWLLSSIFVLSLARLARAR